MKFLLSDYLPKHYLSEDMQSFLALLQAELDVWLDNIRNIECNTRMDLSEGQGRYGLIVPENTGLTIKQKKALLKKSLGYFKLKSVDSFLEYGYQGFREATLVNYILDGTGWVNNWGQGEVAVTLWKQDVSAQPGLFNEKCKSLDFSRSWVVEDDPLYVGNMRVFVGSEVWYVHFQPEPEILGPYVVTEYDSQTKKIAVSPPLGGTIEPGDLIVASECDLADLPGDGILSSGKLWSFGWRLYSVTQDCPELIVQCATSGDYVEAKKDFVRKISGIFNPTYNHLTFEFDDECLSALEAL